MRYHDYDQCFRTVQLLFFFQAEDGIRDVAVTGVQTCALPICVRPVRAVRAVRVGMVIDGVTGPGRIRSAARSRTEAARGFSAISASDAVSAPREIGRASCRERV